MVKPVSEDPCPWSRVGESLKSSLCGLCGTSAGGDLRDPPQNAQNVNNLLCHQSLQKKKSHFAKVCLHGVQFDESHALKNAPIDALWSRIAFFRADILRIRKAGATVLIEMGMLRRTTVCLLADCAPRWCLIVREIGGIAIAPAVSRISIKPALHPLWRRRQGVVGL